MKVTGRCVTGFVLLILIAISAAGRQRAYDLENAGLREYRAGNLSAAESLFAQAMEAAADKNIQAVTSNDLGNTELSADRLQSAYAAYSRALDIFSSMPGKDLEVAAILLNLASVDAQEGNYNPARKSLTEARTIVISHPAPPESQLLSAEISNIEGIVLLQQGKVDKALAVFENATRTRVAAGAPEDLGDAQTLSNIGMIELQKHKYELPLEHFCDTMSIPVRKMAEMRS